jgi:hypothetical protein
MQPRSSSRTTFNSGQFNSSPFQQCLGNLGNGLFFAVITAHTCRRAAVASYSHFNMVCMCAVVRSFKEIKYYSKVADEVVVILCTIRWVELHQSTFQVAIQPEMLIDIGCPPMLSTCKRKRICYPNVG